MQFRYALYNEEKKGMHMDIRKRLARNVIRLRKERGISQENFAARCRISTRYLSTIETGRANPSIDVLERISRAFDISLEELVHFPDSP